MMATDAVRKGTILVNLPVLLLILAGMFVSTKILQGPWMLAGMFAAIPLAWLYWSIAVPRWRIWVMQQDVDLIDVEAAAIRAGLIWPEGSVFGKTEIPAWPREMMRRKIADRFSEESQDEGNR